MIRKARSETASARNNRVWASSFRRIVFHRSVMQGFDLMNRDEVKSFVWFKPFQCDGIVT